MNFFVVSVLFAWLQINPQPPVPVSPGILPAPGGTIVVSGPIVGPPFRIAKRGQQICLPGNPGQAGFQKEILVWDTDCVAASMGAGSSPWGAKLAPGGQFLYVTLAGFFGTQNCIVEKIDLDTDTVVATISLGPDGLFPEEMVFTTQAGQMQNLYVSCSESSTVKVIGANDQVIATIPIPLDPGTGLPTAYPFGLALSPNQQRVYVGTLDGSGNIYVIDTATNSLVLGETLYVPDGHGRMAFYKNTLVVPATVFHPAWAGSTGNVVFIDPTSPGSAVTVTLATSTEAFPSPQDLGIRCDGKVYIAGFDLGTNVYVLSAKSKSYLGAIPFDNFGGGIQGVGLSKKGMLAIADLFTSELIMIDTWSEQITNVVDLSGLPSFLLSPQECEFSGNGNRLFVPFQFTDNVGVFQVQ